jgi:hypothetical protein
MPDQDPFRLRMRLSQVQRGARTLEVVADDRQRAAIADALSLDALKTFEAEVRLTPWLDGAEIAARWRDEVTQTCGVSLDPFDTPLTGVFTVRVVPAGSDAASPEDHEVSIDPEADDPPDVLEGEEIDIGAYLVEHLALEIDPFPRKPGVTFEPLPAEQPPSPFAVLKALKPEN